MSQFELNWVGEYIPQAVMENDFLNQKLESDTYGIYYSVQFQGDADTYLLQAKKPPVVGEPEWGMIEMSKSGKSKRFKRVKNEGGGNLPVGSKPQSDKPFFRDASTIPLDVWRTLIGIQNVPTNPTEFSTFFETVKTHADELISMIDNVRGTSDTSSKEAASPPAKPTPETSPIKDKLEQGFSEPEYTEADMP